MRRSIARADVTLLRYEIREIVDTVQRLKELDSSFKVENENIGDPIAKGWPVPSFLKTLLKEEIDKPGDAAFGYTHSRGAVDVRHWVADYSRRYSPSSTLDYEDVLMTSGLGAAISMMYQMLPPGSRVLQPSPTYPTHAAMEAFAAGQEVITYQLDPLKGWEPDLADMEAQVLAHPEIVALLVIHPNNPTGAIYSRSTLEGIVALAEKYDLMIFSDEIYFRLVYNGYEYTQMTELAQGRVPLVVMRGLSKDVPWPGGRCGWLEFHNQNLDPDFKKYADAVKKRVLMEVCSTHLPQVVMPRIYDHPAFEAWLKDYNAALEANSRAIAARLSQVKGLRVNATNGAFYMLPTFEEGVLNAKQTLPIHNAEARAFVEAKVSVPGFALDKRFVYYLLASTGICTVPASGFSSSHPGFRITTLTRDPQKRDAIYDTLARAIEAYLAS